MKKIKKINTRQSACFIKLLLSIAVFCDLNKLAQSKGPIVLEANNSHSQLIRKEKSNNLLELQNLAHELENNGNHIDALKANQLILKIKIDLSGAADYSVGNVLTNIGRNHMNLGNYKEAENSLKEAQKIFSSSNTESKAKISEAMNQLGTLYKEQGNYSKAEEHYLKALKNQVDSIKSDPLITGVILQNLAGLYVDQGKYSKAESYLLRALDIVEEETGPNSIITALTLNTLAIINESQGLYRQAEKIYVKILPIIEKEFGPDHLNTANVLDNLSNLYLELGDFNKSESLSVKAMSIREKVLGTNHPDVALSLNNLAIALTSRGLYGKAEPHYVRALEIYKHNFGLEHPGTTLSMNNLANLYTDQKLYSKALPIFEKVLQINKNMLGLNHPITAASISNLGAINASLGENKKAESLYMQSLKIKEIVLPKNHIGIGYSLHNLAVLYGDQELYEKAISYSQRALNISQESLGEYHPKTHQILADLAAISFDAGQYMIAENAIKRAIQIQAILIQREAPFLSISERQEYIKTFGRVSELSYSLAQKNSKFNVLALFSRINLHGILAEIERNQSKLTNLPGKHKEIAQELRSTISSLSSLTLEPDKRKKLNARREELERTLYDILPSLKPRVTSIEQILDALPNKGVLIEFQKYNPYVQDKKPFNKWSKTRYMAIILNDKNFISTIDLGPAKDIDNAIYKMTESIEKNWSDSPELIDDVYQLVIKPLKKATSDASNWFISADGEFNRMPLNSFRVTDENHSYLSELVNLRLITTGRELIDLKKQPKGSRSENLIVADPSYDAVISQESDRDLQSDEKSNKQVFRSADNQNQIAWGRLIKTAIEGGSIQALIGGKLITREQATSNSIKQMPAPKVVHLATHAFYLPKKAIKNYQAGQKELIDQDKDSSNTENIYTANPLIRSGLVLSGANNINANPDNDGYLTALEVTHLDWDGTELVVVSGCESGRGEIRSGEGIYGLKRAIAVAGARSSLLSLWKVDDEATAAFMISFYTRLKAGMGRGDALSATQKEFRSHPNEDWREPYVWAAFQLSGDWGPIEGL